MSDLLPKSGKVWRDRHAPEHSEARFPEEGWGSGGWLGGEDPTEGQSSSVREAAGRARIIAMQTSSAGSAVAGAFSTVGRFVADSLRALW
ncbi:MAG: hypothetical protein QM607_05875, partial [Microbacterium sp.]